MCGRIVEMFFGFRFRFRYSYPSEDVRGIEAKRKGVPAGGHFR